MKLQDTHRDRLTVIGVTEAPVDETLAFHKQHNVTYFMLADAAADREAFGIDIIWGNQVYLISPDGNIVAESPGDVDTYLAKHLG